MTSFTSAARKCISVQIAVENYMYRLNIALFKAVSYLFAKGSVVRRGICIRSVDTVGAVLTVSEIFALYVKRCVLASLRYLSEL